MEIIGIILGVIALGLIYWFKKDQQMTNLKSGLSTTKQKLRPYSQRELRQIAASIEQYRRTLRVEYTWTDQDGKVHVAETRMSGTQNERLHCMVKDIHRGSYTSNASRRATLKVIGETVC